MRVLVATGDHVVLAKSALASTTTEALSLPNR